MSGYYRLEYYDGSLSYSVRIYQMPAFLMQMLAAVRAGEMSESDFFWLNVAPYMEETKGRLVLLSKPSKIDHPHYCESYYLLATIIT